MTRRRWLAAALAVRPFASGAPAPITLESLLAEMVDRDALARLPDPLYRCAQASSYDRKHTAPDQPGWFSNDDYSQFIRPETRGGRTEWVMMDAEGPGAIVRFWMGAPSPDQGPPGTLRFYFDGSDDPGIEETADRLLSGASFVAPPLAAVRSIGRNLYLPIPYERRCTVTYDRPNYWQSKADEDRTWYAIGYRTYPPGTAVRTFRLDDYVRARPVVESTGKTLLSGFTTAIAPKAKTLGAGQSVSHRIDGSGAVRELSVTVAADSLPPALRAAVITIDFDGEPAVSCPAGDFFGSGYGLNPYRDWWRCVREDGTMTCRWVMPFERSCTIRVQNRGTQRIQVTLGPVLTSPWRWDERSLHFHCGWRGPDDIQTQAREGQDWNYIEIDGEGLYAGDTLTIRNGSSKWWGEGNEKIFVDGERFPSLIGTGTEDYYGYSFGDRGEFFEAPFHAEPRWEGNHSPGYTVNTRTRSLDAIPFRRSLRFDMEIWHWDTTRMSYAAAVYWYARPGAKSNRHPA